MPDHLRILSGRGIQNAQIDRARKSAVLGWIMSHGGLLSTASKPPGAAATLFGQNTGKRQVPGQGSISLPAGNLAGRQREGQLPVATARAKANHSSSAS